MKKNINRATLDEGLRLSNLAYSNKTIENGIASAYVEETDDLVKIGFTGTDENNDWWHNLNFLTDDLRTLVNKEQELIDKAEEVDRRRLGSGVPEGLNVHKGFYDHLNLIYRQVADRIGNKNYEIAGHSLGGAMATIFAIRYYGETGRLPVSVITFGSPRVFYGDTKPYEDLIDVIRVAIIDDAVVFMPPLKLGWKHVGTPVLYNMANMVTPTIMDKGFDEDQLATFFLNELVSSVRTVTLNTGYKMAVSGLASKLTNNIIKPGEYSTEELFNQASIYPNNLQVEERIAVGKDIYSGVKETLDSAIEGLTTAREEEINRAYGSILEDADNSGMTSLTQGIIDQLYRDLNPLFGRLSGDLGSKLKATLQESAADINTEQASIQLEAARKSFIRQTSERDEIFELLTTTSMGDKLNDAVERLVKDLTEAGRQVDNVKLTLDIMNTIFGFTQMGLTIATYWTLLNHAYNTYRAVHFHGLDLYQSLVDSMPVEHRNTIIDNFYNEYKFVGTDDNGNKIYEDFDGNRFILAGGKEGVYLESISTEPKILGYIHLTKDIQAGSVVVYE